MREREGMHSPEDGLSTAQRGVLIGGCAVALGGLVPVALYQLGVIGHLPDPPCAWFDSDRITSSRTAHPFGIPDGLLGMASYATTLALICATGRSRQARRLLGAKLGIDGAIAGFNSLRQLVSFRRICSWCMITAGATAVLLYTGHDLVEMTSTEAAEAPDAAMEG